MVTDLPESLLVREVNGDGEGGVTGAQRGSSQAAPAKDEIQTG